MEFFLLKLKNLKNYCILSLKESKLKTTVILLLFIFVFLGCFFLSQRGFSFLLSFVFGEFISLHFLNFFLFVILLMVAFSAFVILFSTLYSKRELGFLLRLPRNLESFFLVLFFESCLLCIWAPFLFSFPFFISFFLEQKINLLYLWGILIAFFLCLLLPPVLVGILLLILTKVWNLTKKRLILIIGIVCVFCFFLFLFNILKIHQVGKEDGLFFLISLLRGFEFADLPIFPNFWLKETIYSAMVDNKQNFILYFLALISIFGSFFSLLWICYLLFYKKTLLKTFEFMPRSTIGGSYKALGFLHNPFLIKDLILFTRDFGFIIQGLVFIGFFIFYWINIKYFSRYVEIGLYRDIAISLNLLALGFIFATFCLRFIFPLFSIEIKKFWLLVLYQKRFSIFKEKLMIGILLTLPFGFLLALLSSFYFKLNSQDTLIYSVISALQTAILTSLAVCFGILLPNPKKELGKIPAGFGGVLYCVFSFIYLFLVTVFYYLKQYFVVFLISIILALLFFKKTQKKLLYLPKYERII